MRIILVNIRYIMSLSVFICVPGYSCNIFPVVLIVSKDTFVPALFNSLVIMFVTFSMYVNVNFVFFLFIRFHLASVVAICTIV